MNKKQLLHSLNGVYTRLGCGKSGVGVFAIRLIPKGTNPFTHCDSWGDVLEISESELATSSAPEEAKNMIRDFCALQNGIYYVPDYGIDAIDKSYYLNHSDTPNMTTHDKGESFVAARIIKTGEELTVNYDLYNEAQHFTRE